MNTYAHRPNDGHEHQWEETDDFDFMGAEYDRCTLCGLKELVVVYPD